MAKRTAVPRRGGSSSLGICERSFRRHIDRYDEAGLEGLLDKRLAQISHRRAPVDEVLRLPRFMAAVIRAGT